jgi:hypothetical protein
MNGRVGAEWAGVEKRQIGHNSGTEHFTEGKGGTLRPRRPVYPSYAGSEPDHASFTRPDNHGPELSLPASLYNVLYQKEVNAHQAFGSCPGRAKRSDARG